MLPDRKFDLRALNRMDADVQVAIATFDLGDDAKVAPLRDLYTHLTLRDGKLDLAELRAQVAGGQVTGQSSLTTQPASAVAQWRADLRFAGMQLEQWLRALQREGRPVASGRLTARMQVQGKGSSTAGILATLQGQAGAAIRQGTVSHLLVELAGLDVAQALGVYVRGDAPLPLNCAVMQAEIQDGLLRTREAFLDTRDSSVRINGQINLADESLALRAELKPKDFSPFSLRTPLVVTGTLGAPQVGVDQRRLLTRVAAALALGAAAGPAALLPFIELGSDKGEDAQPCAAPR